MPIKMICILLVVVSSCSQSPTTPDDKNKKLHIWWSIEAELIEAPSASPLIIDNSWLVYTGEHELIAIYIEDGGTRWKGRIDGKRALDSKTMLYYSNRIVSAHGNIVLSWKASTGDQVLKLDQTDGISVFALGKNALVDEGYAFVGDTLDAYVINLDGTKRFEIDVPLGTAGLTYANGKLYLGKARTIHGALTLGQIRAFDSQTGDSLWTYDTENGGFSWAAPIVEDGVVYAGAAGNSERDVFVALDAETGAVKWEFLSDDPLKWTQSFTIGPNHIFASGSGKIFALDKRTGELAWDYGWESSTLVEPVYLGGYVYQSNHGSVFVLDAKTGKLVHEEPAPEGGGYIWHLAVSEDKLFVQSSYKLVAYQPWHLRKQ